MREQRLCSYAIKLSVRNQEPSLARCAPDVMQAVILCSKNNGVSTYGFSCNQKQCGAWERGYVHDELYIMACVTQ